MDYNNFLLRHFHLALKELKTFTDLKISSTDEGGKIVLMDMGQYNGKINSIRGDKKVYETINYNPLKNMQKKFNKRFIGYY